MCSRYYFAITYIALALAPCFYSFIVANRTEECRKYQDFLVTGACFLIIQFPFWKNLPILLYIQITNIVSQPFATASFIIEIPYILTGSYLSINGMSLFDTIEAPENGCSPEIGYYVLFELILSTLLLGCLWMLSIPYFVDIVMVTARRRLKFTLTSISISSAIILISALLAIVYNDLQACEEPLLSWVIIGALNLIIFFSIFFSLVSLSHDHLSEAKSKLLSAFLAFIYLPFNVFWFMKGMGWISSAVRSDQEHGGNHLKYTNSIYLLVLMYEWIICFLMFCVLILSYLVFTNHATSQNLFRPEVQINLPFELDFQHQQEQNNVELVERLHSVNFRPQIHSESFKEKGVCPICWDPFQDTQKVIYLQECNHVFHGSCIKQWALKNATCPSCRRPITGSDNRAIENQSQEV